MVSCILQYLPTATSVCICGKGTLGDRKETAKFYIWICPACGSLYYYRKKGGKSGIKT